MGAPFRSTVPFGGDIISEFKQKTADDCLIKDAPGSERMKYAATAMAKVSRVHGYEDAFHSIGPTWFGEASDSKISHLMMPKEMQPLVRKFVVLKELGHQIQHPNVRYRLDHYPMMSQIALQPCVGLFKQDSRRIAILS